MSGQGQFRRASAPPDLLRRLAWGALVAAIAAGPAGYGLEARRQGRLIPDRTLEISDLPELSGLAWVAERASLVAVTDDGLVADISADGVLGASRAIGRKDLEDVVWDSRRRCYWILEEKSSKLLAVDPLTWVISGEWPVMRSGSGGRNHGYEGLTLGPGPGRFFIACESRPAGFGVFECGGSGLANLMLAGAPSLTALIAAPDGSELLLVSRERGLMMVSIAGECLTPWRRIPSAAVESAALVPGRGLVLGTDEQAACLLLFHGLDDWQKLKEALVGGG